MEPSWWKFCGTLVKPCGTFMNLVQHSCGSLVESRGKPGVERCETLVEPWCFSALAEPSWNPKAFSCCGKTIPRVKRHTSTTTCVQESGGCIEKRDVLSPCQLTLKMDVARQVFSLTLPDFPTVRLCLSPSLQVSSSSTAAQNHVGPAGQLLRVTQGPAINVNPPARLFTSRFILVAPGLCGPGIYHKSLCGIHHKSLCAFKYSLAYAPIDSEGR